MSDTKETTRPMTAEEYWTKENGDIILFDIIAKQIAFAESYATYRLQFERRQHQNSWMPTHNEWRRHPDANCAAMDKDGRVFLYYVENLLSLYPDEDNKGWAGHNGDYWFIKSVEPVDLDWTKCKVARPEGV